MVLFEEFERIRRPTMICCLLLITLLLSETIGVAEALSSSSSSPKRKTQLLTSSSMKTLPTSLFPKTTTAPTSATSSKNKPDDKNEKRSTTTTTTKSSSSSSSSSSSNVEYYTNYWDNLLLEEYELASNEWKERRKRCSPQTLEKRGLAILQAFAVPDSEILGEKTVRIHSGISNSGSTGMDGAIMIASSDSDSTSSSQGGGGRRRRSSNHHRPWKEIFGKGDVLEMTSAAAATTGGGEFSSSTPLRKECLVIDVYDNNEMIVSVGKSWPYGLWEARKGSAASGFGRTKDKNSQSSYGLPIRIDKTPNGAALVPLRSQRSALQKIRENKGGSISKWLASSTTNDNKKKRSRRWASQIPYHFRRESLYNDEEMEEQRQLKSSLREATERVISRYDSSSSNSKRRRRRCYLTPNESQKDAITYALSRRVSAIHGPPGTGTYYNSFYRMLDKIRLDYDVLYYAKEYSDRISSLTVTFSLTRTHTHTHNLVSL